MSDTIIEFPKRKAAVVPLQGTGFNLPGTQAPAPLQGAFYSHHSGSTAPVIEIDKLYPAEQDSKSKIVAALSLLADAISLLENARISARDTKLIEADRYVQRFEKLLLPLFAQRTIGDGFAGTINSLHFALINQHGEPLTFEQLSAIWRVLKELRNTPFVTFDQSLQWIEEFEECRLRVDPPTLATFIDDESE